MGWFRREFLFLCSAVTSLWPLAVGVRGWLAALWFCSCIILGGFTLLPLETGDQIWLVVCGALLAVCLGVLSTKHLYEPLEVHSTRKRTRSAENLYAPTGEKRKFWRLFMLHVALIIGAVLVVLDTTRSLRSGQGLPRLNQYISWAILGIVYRVHCLQN